MEKSDTKTSSDIMHEILTDVAIRALNDICSKPLVADENPTEVLTYDISEFEAQHGVFNPEVYDDLGGDVEIAAIINHLYARGCVDGKYPNGYIWTVVNWDDKTREIHISAQFNPIEFVENK